MKSNPAFVFHYLPGGTYALNVLQGALESRGLDETATFHQTRKVEELITTIDALLTAGHAPVHVFWSFFSAGFSDAVKKLHQVKELFPRRPVVHTVGGVHASAEPKMTAHAGFDRVAIGEGEATIVSYVRAILEAASLDTVPGLAWIENGVYRTSGVAPRINLDDYPPFAIRHRRFNPIEITRGCIYACRFCQTPFMFKAKFRHRSVENICQYVTEMKNRGLTDIRFITPTSLSYGSNDETVNLNAVENLLGSVRQIIGNEGRIFFGSFPSEVRPEHVSPEVLHILRKYVDNDNLIIGGQSGSEIVLERSKRGHGVAEIERAVRYTVEAGFKPYVDFIFGLPGETENDAQRSVQFADRLVRLGAKVHGHSFMPLPGTPFKDESPARISQQTRNSLNRLTSRGGLYGKWVEQLETARRLSRLRTKSPVQTRGGKRNLSAKGKTEAAQ